MELYRKLYGNAIQEIISDTSKFEKINEGQTLKREASLQLFLCELKHKTFLTKMNMIYYILLVLLLLVSVVLLTFPNVIHFLNFVVSYIATFNYNLPRFLCDLLSPLVPNNYTCKDTFSFVSQIKNANLYRKFVVSFDVTSNSINIPIEETIDTAINLTFNHNPNLNMKRNLKTFVFLLHHSFILLLIVNFIIKLME